MKYVLSCCSENSTPVEGGTEGRGDWVYLRKGSYRLGFKNGRIDSMRISGIGYKDEDVYLQNRIFSVKEKEEMVNSRVREMEKSGKLLRLIRKGKIPADVIEGIREEISAMEDAMLYCDSSTGVRKARGFIGSESPFLFPDFARRISGEEYPVSSLPEESKKGYEDYKVAEEAAERFKIFELFF